MLLSDLWSKSRLVSACHMPWPKGRGSSFPVSILSHQLFSLQWRERLVQSEGYWMLSSITEHKFRILWLTGRSKFWIEKTQNQGKEMSPGKTWSGIAGPVSVTAVWTLGLSHCRACPSASLSIRFLLRERVMAVTLESQRQRACCGLARRLG